MNPVNICQVPLKIHPTFFTISTNSMNSLYLSKLHKCFWVKKSLKDPWEFWSVKNLQCIDIHYILIKLWFIKSLTHRLNILIQKIQIYFFSNYSVYKQDSVEIINKRKKKIKNLHQHNIRNSINHDNIWRHKNI